jgi:hypothetical protein
VSAPRPATRGLDAPKHKDPDNDALQATATAQATDWLDSPVTDPQTALLDHEDTSTDNADTLPPFDAEPAPGAAAVREPFFAQTHTPSFLRNDEARSIWRRPAVRIGLLIALVVLLAVLAAQLLIKERDRVAAMQPSLRPVLEALCAVSGCRLSALRQIESVVIDSSSFSRVRGDDYRLGFSLRNTAAIDIEMPAIELALTDPRDQAVIRRVILPAEFGAPSAALASASVWTGSLALNVQPGASSDRIAGYRLLAFYP